MSETFKISRNLSAAESPETELLTDIEMEIISLIGKGVKDHELVNQLNIDEIALFNQINRIYKKLRVSGRLGLVMRAYQKGLLEAT